MRTTALAFVCLITMVVGAASEDLIVVGWNDLGMHCANKDFHTLVILPPYNNIRAQVIQRGDSANMPQVLTGDYRVAYEIPGNTYSVGKTDFWDYDLDLFGVDLPPDIGLTGAGLSGDMSIHENYFMVDGVPITAWVDSDLVNEDPFQLGLLSLYNSSEELQATTQPVVPVSSEISCLSSGCHFTEQGILNLHASEAGFDPNDTPILCADCHEAPALGMPGLPGIPSLSEAVHKQHGEHTDDCYTCHPGPNTECLRGVMQSEHGMVCQDCHGTTTEVGESIADGRRPWFDEPSCGAVGCHGAQYAEEPGKLFRESRGHSGLFCSACHGSPHAIAPSRVDRDNVQNIALQGHAGTLDDCTVCHGVVPAGAGPHGLYAAGQCCNLRADINHNGEGPDIADLVYLVNFMFNGGPPPCTEVGDGYPEADIDGSGSGPDIADLVYLVNYMFNGGPPPVPCPSSMI